MLKDKLNVLTENISGRWSGLRARVQDLLAGMTPRDRVLLFGLVGFFSVLLLVGSTVAMTSHLDSKAEVLRDREFELKQVEVLQEEFETAQAQMVDIAAKMETHAKTTLATFLEKAAAKAQITDALKEVDQRSVAEFGGLQETSYAVRLSRITLEQLVGFLYEVETAGFPVRITTLKVKTVYVSGEKFLDINLDMAAVKIVEEETTG